METREVKLGDIITYNKGYAFKSNEYTDNGKIVVRVTDFTLDSISDNDSVYLEPNDKYKKFIINTNDILIQTVGSWANNPNSIVGKVVRVPDKCDKAYLNQNIVRIIPNKDFDNTYLYYALKANQFSMYCVLRGQGAANQASITLDTIFKFKFRAHFFSKQKKIADILSAYDDLIENNNKRIKLLEQMAENLYKEWFVRFRFPGYEDVEFEENIPSNWNYIQLSDIISFERGISYSSAEINCDDGINLVNLKNIQSYGGFRREGTKKYNGKYKDSQIVNTGDLILGVTDMTQDRRTVGSVALMPIMNGISVISADLVKITSKVPNQFLYCMCRYGFYSKYFSQFANGANVLHLKPNTLMNKKILLPTGDLIKDFTKNVIPMLDMIDKMNLQNDVLIKQRDLLLPRLMSGKLEA